MKRFRGWEPKTTTQNIYKNRRIVRTYSTVETEWDTEQLELMLAYDAYKRDVGQHGHLLSRSTSPDADPNNYASPLRYVARGPFTDYAKKAEDDAIDAYRAQFSDDQKPNMNGMYWTVEEITE